MALFLLFLSPPMPDPDNDEEEDNRDGRPAAQLSQRGRGDDFDVIPPPLPLDGGVLDLEDASGAFFFMIFKFSRRMLNFTPGPSLVIVLPLSLWK